MPPTTKGVVKMSVIKGDFIGFTFNNVHSSELGIMRVSDGNRYTENLLPAFQEKTVQVPGADGTYYFGSYYTQKQIDLSIVFDEMTQEQFVRAKQLFGDKNIHSLIFDESPYKYYKVKSTGTPNFKYVCFDKDRDKNERDFHFGRDIRDKSSLYGVNARKHRDRIYKGEGQLNFMAYMPYARSRYKYANEYVENIIPEWDLYSSGIINHAYRNIDEWNDSVGLKYSNEEKKHNGYSYQLDVVYPNENSNNPPGVMFYNPGDLPTNFYLYLIPFSGTSFNGVVIEMEDFPQNTMTIGDFELQTGDVGIRINSALNLIEGVKGEKGEVYEPTGTIYNEYIKAGDFFKIPLTSDLSFMSFTAPTGSSLTDFTGAIEYDYLFY